MNLKNFILIIFLCSYGVITAQEYDNFIYNHNGNTIFTESRWKNDSLIVVGAVRTSFGRSGATFKITSEHEVINTNLLTDSIIDYSTGFWDKGFIKIGDTVYHIALKEYNNGDINSIISKFDECGNSLFEKEFMSYYYPDDNFDRFRDFQKVTDGFIILDYARKTATDFQPCLIKVDNNFNEIWRKCYGNQYQEIPNDLEVLSDGSIVIIGNSTNIDITDQYTGSGNGFIKGFIMFFDPFGNFKWEWRSNSKKEALYASYLASDSLLVIAAGMGKEYCSDSQSNALCQLIWSGKVLEFNLKSRVKTWETSLASGNYAFMTDNNYLDIIPSIEGDGYILCGAGYYEIPDCRTDTIDKCWANPGIIAKVSNTGDSLWLRKYFGVTGITESNILFDAEITPDSGYSFVGEAFTAWFGPTQGQHGWVLKTDKYGCLIPGCQLGTSIQIDLPKNNNDIIRLYPNPVSDYLNIIVNKEFNKKTKIVIANILGESISTYSNIEIGSNYSIPTSNLKSGVYIIYALEGNVIIGAEKFVVNN